MATINQLPAKSPILDKYRSRLQITYRTNISGTPVPLKLPFRVLVMGEFQGKEQRDAAGTSLRLRTIRSIQMGAADASVPAFMKELTPWMRLPEGQRSLEAHVPGHVVFDRLTFPNPADSDFDATGVIEVPVTGFATFTSSKDDNGTCAINVPRIPVTGKVTVKKDTARTAQGTLALTLTGVVTGDIKDTSDKPIGVLVALFAKGSAPQVEVDVDVTANGVVTAADPDDPTLLALAIPADKNTFAVQAVRALPFQSLNAFSPDQVAANIPELQRLSLIRSIVLELQSNLRNNRPFANAVRAVLLQPDKLKDFRTWAKANYPELALSL